MGRGSVHSQDAPVCILGLLSHVLEGFETPGLGAKHTMELWAKAFRLPTGTAGQCHLVAGGLPCLFSGDVRGSLSSGGRAASRALQCRQGGRRA